MLELAKDEYDLMVEWSEANAVPEEFLFALRKIQLSELIKQGKIRQAVHFGQLILKQFYQSHAPQVQKLLTCCLIRNK
jgi:hypothetical protein